MNLRSPSFNLTPHPAPISRRPSSISSRLSSAVSNAEQDEIPVTNGSGEALIEEEIAEIKRYEVSSHTQWLIVRLI